MKEYIPKGYLTWKTLLPGAVLQAKIQSFKCIHNKCINTKASKCCCKQTTAGIVHFRYKDGFAFKIKLTDLFGE